MKFFLCFFMGIIIYANWSHVAAQSNYPIEYAQLLENQNSPFTKGEGEVRLIDGVAWERPYGEFTYVIPPSMPSITEYRNRITKLDHPETNFFKSKFHFLNVEITELSKSLLKDMGIIVMDYVKNQVNIYLPEIDIDILAINNINFKYLDNYGTQIFQGESIQDIQSTILFTEGFEGAFPGTDYTTSLFGSANCGWDDVSCWKYAGARSIWCASLGAACNACLGDYVNDMGAAFFRQTTINTTGYNDFWFKWRMDYDFYNIGSNDKLTRYYWLGSSWTLSTTSYTSASALDGSLWNQHSFFYAGTLTNYSFEFAFYSNSVGASYGVYIDEIEFSGTAISTAGIPENISMSIQSYPNPFIESLSISIQSLKEMPGQLMAYSIDGKELYNQNISLAQGNNNFQINTSLWSTGSYILKLASNEGIKIAKVVKE